MRKRALFALVAILAGTMLACGSEGGVVGASDVAGGDPLFGGRCVPSQGLRTRALTAECRNTFGGHAQVVGALVDVALVKVGVDLVSTGELPASGGVKDSRLLRIDGLSGAIIGDTASAFVGGTGNQAAAEAEVQALRIHLGVINVDADVVKSRSEARCGSRAGDSVITNLRINGIVVSIEGRPNEHIVRGLVRVTINEQIATANGMRTNALHISGLGVADIVVAQSEAAITCSCSDGPPGSGPDGGSPGSDPNGGTPGSDPDGGTPGSDPNGGAPGSGPDSGTPGSDPNGGSPGSGPDGGSPGSDPNGGAPGSDPNGGAPGSDPNGGPPGSGPDSGSPGSDPNGGAPGSGPNGGGPGSGPDSGAPGSGPDGGPSGQELGEGDSSGIGGAFGAKCDDDDACATGYYCAGQAPTIR